MLSELQKFTQMAKECEQKAETKVRRAEYDVKKLQEEISQLNWALRDLDNEVNRWVAEHVLPGSHCQLGKMK